MERERVPYWPRHAFSWINDIWLSACGPASVDLLVACSWSDIWVLIKGISCLIPQCICVQSGGCPAGFRLQPAVCAAIDTGRPAPNCSSQDQDHKICVTGSCVMTRPSIKEILERSLQRPWTPGSDCKHRASVIRSYSNSIDVARVAMLTRHLTMCQLNRRLRSFLWTRLRNTSKGLRPHLCAEDFPVPVRPFHYAGPKVGAGSEPGHAKLEGTHSGTQ